MLMLSRARMSTPQLLLFLLSYHVVASAAASPFSFNFDFSDRSSYSSEDLRLEGDAVAQADLVDLTCSSMAQTIQNCVGRMSYNHPVPFYDTTTGVVASFFMQFRFAIRVFTSDTGDGLAFFLSSYPSMLPESPDGGGTLGLHNGNGTVDAQGTKWFIAVEFDTFKNYFDLSPNHIGVDINTVKPSVNTTILPEGSLNGSMTASITFNSTTRMLMASLQFDDNSSLGTYQVSKQLTNPVTTLLPSDVAVGFSATTGTNVELHQIMSWSFNSTLAPRQDKKSNSTAIVLIAVIVPVTLILLLAGMFILWKLYSKDKSGGFLDYAMFEEETPLHIDIRRFTYAELNVITKNFESIIGRGGFGIVYHGILENGDEVAVKILTETSISESIDFLPEVQTLSKVHHKNLVTLQGYCQNKKCLALVYDFMPWGNLQQLLRGGYDNSLNWEQRLHIAFDAAQGLEYLHELCTPSIVHRDVKTPNILLDKNLVGIISDFGLARAFNDAHTHISTIAAGTLGYLDPEYHATFQITIKTDVYSFGIVLLEIITGEPPVIMNPQPIHLPNWVRQKIAKGSIHDVVDKRLSDQYNVDSLQSVIELAMCCVENASIDRPAMTEVVSRLKVLLPVVSTEKRSIHGSTKYKNSIDSEISNQYELTISGASIEGSSFQSGYTGRMSEISMSSGR